VSSHHAPAFVERGIFLAGWSEARRGFRFIPPHVPMHQDLDSLGGAYEGTVGLRRGSGAGPFYTRYEGGTLDPALTSIMTAAESAYFVAQAANGEREIELVVTPGPTASRCAQLYGDWAPTDATPSAIRVPVAPDATSIVFVRCE